MSETIAASEAHGRPVCGRKRGRKTLAEAELIEAVVVDAEVVAQLVNDGLADLFADLVVAPADGLDGLLVDRDLVGEDEVVVLAALREGDAVVEAEERAAGAYPSIAPVTGGGAPFDDDFDVLDAVEEVTGKGSDGFADKTAEAGPFQVATSALQWRPKGCGSPCP